MDYYATIERSLMDLRQTMVNTIRTIFFEHGYDVGETANEITVENDRVLVNIDGRPCHTDYLSTDDLLAAVRKAMHIIYK